MMPLKVTATLLLVSSFLFSFGQCPSNEADLANGGTFSGNCTVDVGGSITITGDVVWTSGTLRIEGGNGDLNLESTFTIRNGATVRIDDDNDGDVDIQNGGALIVDEGGTLYAREEIQVQTGSSMTVGGTVYSETNDILIDDGGVVTVLSTGSLSTASDEDLLVQGTLDVYGYVYVGDDLMVDGGTMTVYDGGEVESDDDLELTNGATVDLQSGSTVTLDDEFDIEDSNVTIAGVIESTGVDDINIDGNSVVTFEDGADVTFNDMEFGTGDGASQVIMNGGDLELLGEVDFNDGTDGDAIVVNGGVLDIGNDLEIGSTDGTITVNPGGTVNTPLVDGEVYDDPNDLPSNIVLSGGSFGVNGVELPVELLSFTGGLFEGKQIVQLSWSTGSEIDNRGFFVERSIDGQDFEKIAFVEGHGTTTDIHEYAFIDQTIEVSSYYQLRQVDFDGVNALSYLIYVSLIDATSNDPISIYPNPTYGEVTFDGLRQEVYDIQMMNLSGKVVLSLASTSLENSEVEINRYLTGATKGVYLLRFANPGYSEIIRLISK
ncbi:MAG: T9SS type A sorting domain-containing protein [Cyclobacteriaceae bacterium]